MRVKFWCYVPDERHLFDQTVRLCAALYLKIPTIHSSLLFLICNFQMLRGV